MDLRRHLVPISIAALLLCYASSLRGMVDQWITDEDMGHGFLVPLVIVWIVWRERKQWQALPVKPELWGFGVMLLGAGIQAASAVGAGLFAGSLAFLVSAAGMVLALWGVAWLRFFAFPFVLALFMLPKLAFLYNQATLPLELLASRMAAGILTMAGFHVIRSGNILDIAGHRISVVEACNGVRYLLPLAFMSLVLSYATRARLWLRIALLAATVPIAIVANAVRVAAAGSWPPLGEGAPHAAAGMVIFILCLATLVVFRSMMLSLESRFDA